MSHLSLWVCFCLKCTQLFTYLLLRGTNHFALGAALDQLLPVVTTTLLLMLGNAFYNPIPPAFCFSRIHYNFLSNEPLLMVQTKYWFIHFKNIFSVVGRERIHWHVLTPWSVSPTCGVLYIASSPIKNQPK